VKHVHDTSVKIAIIAAATVLVSVVGDIYLSPLQTCIRKSDHKADWCVRAVTITTPSSM
jgi:hypothetical protein